MRKTLSELFEIENKKSNYINSEVSDYSVFKDKNLLDSLRNKIIQNIIDNDLSDSKYLEEYINDEINTSLEGYDLTNLERNHIFNLIENEINGYGPITELLDDKSITELMVNAPDEIYIEIYGKIIKDDSV